MFVCVCAVSLPLRFATLPILLSGFQVSLCLRALIFIVAIDVTLRCRLPRHSSLPGSSYEVPRIILRYVRWGMDRTTVYKTESLAKLLYGAEHYSRGHQLCSHSTVSQHFMEPEGSLPRQELFTCFYPEQDQSSPHHAILYLQDSS
jgi:hypothetical protein